MNQLVDRRFGRLIAVKESGRDEHGHLTIECRCDCGVTKSIARNALRSGATKSCGCYQRDELVKRARHGFTRRGVKRKSEYGIWAGILQRCNNPNNPAYSYYGGRGIKVCVRWFQFDNFYKDMGNKPSPAHTLERKDNNSGYSKENCRWATRLEQQNNTRVNRMVVFDGKSMSVSAWARVLGVKRRFLDYRINSGLSMDKIFEGLCS